LPRTGGRERRGGRQRAATAAATQPARPGNGEAPPGRGFVGLP